MAANVVTPTSRETDRLLQRIRALVRDRRRADASAAEREARTREIERLKAQLAEIVKRTAGKGHG